LLSAFFSPPGFLFPFFPLPALCWSPERFFPPPTYLHGVQRPVLQKLSFLFPPCAEPSSLSCEVVAPCLSKHARRDLEIILPGCFVFAGHSLKVPPRFISLSLISIFSPHNPNGSLAVPAPDFDLLIQPQNRFWLFTVPTAISAFTLLPMWARALHCMPAVALALFPHFSVHQFSFFCPKSFFFSIFCICLLPPLVFFILICETRNPLFPRDVAGGHSLEA